MQNYIKILNYQTFYQKNNEKSFFLSLIDENQGKNDNNIRLLCVRKQQAPAELAGACRENMWVGV